MKIIVRLDTDDPKRIKAFKESWDKSDNILVPKCEEVEIWVIDDKGNAQLLINQKGGEAKW